MTQIKLLSPYLGHIGIYPVRKGTPVSLIPPLCWIRIAFSTPLSLALLEHIAIPSPLETIGSQGHRGVRIKLLLKLFHQF